MKYLKEYKRFRIDRKLKRVMKAAERCQTVEQNERTNEADYKKKLREFEKKIPEKFLNEKSLTELEVSLKFGFAKTVEEAVKILEESTTE